MCLGSAAIMGNSCARLKQWVFLKSHHVFGHGDHEFKIEIVTGEYKGQNIGSGRGDVRLRLWHVDGNDNLLSEIFTFSGSHFFKGSKNILYVRAPFDKIDQIEIWIYRAGSDPNLNWFVDTIKSTDVETKITTLFPVGRWITMRHQIIIVDSCLPQFDRNEERRHEEVLMNRDWFHFSHFAGGIPTMTDVLATSEFFSKSYFFNVFVKQGVLNKIKQFLLPLFTRSWKRLTQINNIYEKCCLYWVKPSSVDVYMKVLKRAKHGQFDQVANLRDDPDLIELDKMFSAQRLTGTNPAMIRRVATEDVETVEQKLKRSKGAVGSLDDLLKPHMEGNTLQEAVDKELLYMIDYTDVLTDLPCKTGIIAAPIALFFVNKDKDLMPVAIRLFRTSRPESMGRDNPIFTPDNDFYTWLLAKMWFNNADASYHESSSHLGFTHLIMETIYIALQRTVSISHPLYRLMAPHFRYLMNVNSVAWDLLLNETGWVNTAMNIGVEGMLEIIRRKFEGIPEPKKECNEDDSGKKEEKSPKFLVPPWRLDMEGNIDKDIEDRKVENLPKYTFRDDAVAVHKIIKMYVEDKVKTSYELEGEDPEELLHNDYEIQAWGKIMYDPAKPEDQSHSGCGIKGLAFTKPKEIGGELVYFETLDQLIDTITSIIYTCSAAHAAVNFRQYDNYGFPLNYPALLHGDPPRSKGGHGPDHKKVTRTADDILQTLPTKKETLGTMTITNILSNKGTVDKDDKNQLGRFPVQYQYTPGGETPPNVQTFQENLHKLAKEIEKRNKGRKPDEVYKVLDPNDIPNSISL